MLIKVERLSTSDDCKVQESFKFRLSLQTYLTQHVKNLSQFKATQS